MPRMFYISKIDEENSDYYNSLHKLQKQFGVSVAPIVVPIFEGNRDTGGIVESQKAFRLRIAPQFGPVAGAGADLAGLQRPRRGKPFGKSLRHISESDKSYLHNTIHFSNLGFIPAVRRL